MSLLPSATPTHLLELFARLQRTQPHLFADWPASPQDDGEKLAMLERLAELDASYELGAYADKVRELVRANSEANPWRGYSLEAPRGLRVVRFASEEHLRLDAAGADACRGGAAAFVLVAGGLGERLGLPRDRTKLGLAYESLQGWTFLELFLAHLAAFASESNGRKAVDLVVMTSDDTHALTERLLAESPRARGFTQGDRVRVRLLRQPAVPAVMDADGRIAKASRYCVLEKPHGHGDLHTMLHRSGFVREWLAGGVEHVVVFQDTNPGAFLALPACLAACREASAEAGVVCIPRLAKSASGSIVRVVPPPARAAPDSNAKRAKPPAPQPHTANVEYNVLSAVLRGALGRDDENDARTGHSPFPGNTNQLVFRLREYAARLDEAQGRVVPDFCNPKYAGDGSGAFAKPTRLESLMQDYLALVPEDRVAVVLFEDWADAAGGGAHSVYAPAKNALAAAARLAKDGASDGSAASSEAAVFGAWCGLLRAAGCAGVGPVPPPTATWAGVPVPQWPRVVVRPSCAAGPSALAKVFPSPANVRLSARSALVLEGPGTVVVESLDLDGALFVRAADPGAVVVLRRVKEANRGVAFVEGDTVRGYRVADDKTWREVVVDRPERVVVEDP